MARSKRKKSKKARPVPVFARLEKIVSTHSKELVDIDVFLLVEAWLQRNTDPGETRARPQQAQLSHAERDSCTCCGAPLPMAM